MCCSIPTDVIFLFPTLIIKLKKKKGFYLCFKQAGIATKKKYSFKNSTKSQLVVSSEGIALQQKQSTTPTSAFDKIWQHHCASISISKPRSIGSLLRCTLPTYTLSLIYRLLFFFLLQINLLRILASNQVFSQLVCTNVLSKLYHKNKNLSKMLWNLNEVNKIY